MKRIQILGNVGTIKVLDNSLAVSICVNGRVKVSDGCYADSETWFNCLFKRKDTEIKVGDRFWVSGDFKASTYTAQEETRIQIKIFVNDFRCEYRKPQE